MAETVTVEMVAHEARVSTATVSRIINGSGKVSARRRKQVMDAIEKLGYRPNLLAQSLARGQSMNVGVLTQDMASPFFGQMHQGIEQGFQGSGYHPIFVSEEWQDDKQHAALEVLLSRRVDALIVLGGYIEDDVLLELSGQLPLVTVGREVKGLEGSLSLDNEQGGYLATRHLLDLGHRQIACLAGPDTHYDAVDRMAGYLRAFQESDVPLQRDLVIDALFSEEGGVRATERLLKSGKHFTAVFACNDQSAIGAQLALQRHGKRIPQDVSVVGFDDLPSSAFVYPPLTTVRQSAKLLGQAAAAAVICKLEGKTFAPSRLELKLMVRESTGPVSHMPTHTSIPQQVEQQVAGSSRPRKVRLRMG
ncbi:LacI family DNA-binding transcriptional regulator [Deinococcus roseus]|uniref:LacI family transcriptional regulator n=1 Tax=Deinococcus roseus TaxID=392414 RepID=A0ABQ2DH92_9DEIO|nr:LacI family DNA-binding transcriptional regulator [Deinococcus roseus]GGJ57067.1 LacI family transcriptional regulator [Deinococcus roseus]